MKTGLTEKLAEALDIATTDYAKLVQIKIVLIVRIWANLLNL